MVHPPNPLSRANVYKGFRGVIARQLLKISLTYPHERVNTRLAKKGWKVEWDRLIRDLDHLKEIEVSAVGKEVIIRTELRGDTGKVFQAAGVAVPSTVKLINRSESDEA